MEIKDLNTSKMVYDPNSDDFIDRIERLPEFRDFKGDPLQIFQYIALMYDINTPMKSEVGDYWQRKKVIALMCGFKQELDGTFTEDFERILLMLDEEVTALIIIFITSFSNADYMQLVFSWEMMYKVLQQASVSETPDKNHVDTMRKLKADINEMTRKVFQSADYDELAEARKLLYLSAELRRSNFRPEDIAERLMKGDNLAEFNPYGDYSAQQMKFVGDEIPKGR